MRRILALLALFAILGFVTCKKESDDPAICNSDWDIETEAEYDALLNAYTAYAADMTPANCNAYKAAFLSYINALKPFLECASWSTADRQEVQELIDESEDAMNELSCE